MKTKLNRASVFLQLIAHRERWRGRSGIFMLPRCHAVGIGREIEKLKSTLKQGHNPLQRNSGRDLFLAGAGEATVV